MSKNRITFPSELIIRDGKVGIGTSTPTSTFNVLGTAEVTGELKVTSIGSTSGEHIEVKHYRDNGGSVVYQSGDKQLFSLSNDGEFAYVISDDDAKPLVQVTNSGLTTITNLQQEDIKFLSTGSSEATRITAKHYQDNGGSVVLESGENHLFSVDNEPDIYYSINDSEARPAFTVSSSGITTIRDLFQNRINFTSVGSTSDEQIQINHYRNIAYQSDIDNRGAISFDSPTGITTDGITYFPASLFALTNGGGNIFSIRGYSKQSYGGGEGSLAFDVTQDGRVGFGTTSPEGDIEFRNNSLLTGILQVKNKIAFSTDTTFISNKILNFGPVDSNVSSAPDRSVLFSGIIDQQLNGSQTVTITGDYDYSLFRINKFVGLSSVTPAPSGQRNVETILDVKNDGNVKIFDVIDNNFLFAGITTTSPGDGDMFRIDTYNPPFIGTFPTVTPAIRVDKFGYTEISRNVNQISGITTVGIATTTTSLEINATMTFELINNTTLTIKVRGTDGVTRSGIVTLA
jgi:hypothetical protein